VKRVDLKEASLKVESLLRLRVGPVALGLLSEKLSGAVRAERLELKVLRLCQMITLSSTYGWVVEADRDTLAYMCSYVVGLRDELPRELREEYAKYWFKSLEDGLSKIEELYRVPARGHSLVATSPLDSSPFNPDVVILRLNPAQACIALSALQWARYRRFNFTYSGESACSDSLARCLVTGEPSLSIPCFGERRFGHLQDDELIMALLPNHLESLAEGLERLWSRGVRYPIPFLGARADTVKGLPDRYRRFYGENT